MSPLFFSSLHSSLSFYALQAQGLRSEASQAFMELKMCELVEYLLLSVNSPRNECEDYQHL